MERTVLHIVGGHSRERAEQARIVFALGHHAEVYSELGELLEHPPQEGLILAADDPATGPTEQLLGELGQAGVWLPVIATAVTLQVERVVAAVRAGALDYLVLPMEMGQFARRLAMLQPVAERLGQLRRSTLEARMLVGSLSKREGEVLAALSAGCANKEIARQLSISPRTVEIHRANMMGKLRAQHPADAVRLWLAAREGNPDDDAQAAIPASPPAPSSRLLRLTRDDRTYRGRLERLRQRQ